MNKWIPALRLTGIGFYIAICIVGGTLTGWWLGGKKPLFMIIGLVAGLIIAIYGVYRMIRSVVNEQKNRENGK
ncbi:MAG: AtpZ/AtpI family protein [Dehalococcoidales bacterium]